METSLHCNNLSHDLSIIVVEVDGIDKVTVPPKIMLKLSTDLNFIAVGKIV